MNPALPCLRRSLAALLVALVGSQLVACDDDPDIQTGDPPPPDARRFDADFDAGVEQEPKTWHAHIRPLLESRCAGCHEPGAVSGYDLSDTTWRDGEPPVWAGAVVATVLEGRMPPVLPDPDCRPVQRWAQLDEAQRALFEAWRDGGYLEGDAADYIPPAPQPGRLAGQPTLRVDAGAAYIPSFSGDSDHRCLPLDLLLPESTWVSGFAVAPGDRRMARRAELFVVAPAYADALDALDAAAPGVGYPCDSDPGVAGYRPLGVWLPDEPPFLLPPDHGFELDPGSRLVLRMHYTARALEDDVPAERTAVDLWLPESPPGNRVEAVELLHTNLRVPGGRRLTQGRDFTIGVGGTIIGAWGRMGPRGTALDIELDREEDTLCVLDLPRFEADWVGGWQFDPINWLAVAPGDVAELRCTHDDPDDGDTTRSWGPGPDDERCDGTLLIARPRDAIGGRPQCGLFAPCIAECPLTAEGAPDPDCFARCHAVGERLCSPCLLQATGGCARTPCEDELAAFGECGIGCDGADLGCLITRCLEPFGALIACIDGPIGQGECDAPYAACGVQFGP